MKNKIKILNTLDAHTFSLISQMLEEKGYDIFSVSNIRDVKEKSILFAPDVIILDVTIGDENGIAICNELRELKVLNDPIIIFYTNHKDDFVQISALNAGADDYIIRPIKDEILLHRIEALLRRVNRNNIQQVGYSDNNQQFVVDRDLYAVFIEGQKIFLPRKEFELLWLFYSSPGKVFTREEIFKNVWGENSINGNKSIEVHIKKLRNKIGDKYVKTIRGVGYKMHSP